MSAPRRPGEIRSYMGRLILVLDENSIDPHRCGTHFILKANASIQLWSDDLSWERPL